MWVFVHGDGSVDDHDRYPDFADDHNPEAETHSAGCEHTGRFADFVIKSEQGSVE